MFTVSITLQAEKSDKIIGELSSYFSSLGACVINVATKDEEDYFGLQFMVTHPEPEDLFGEIETICIGGERPFTSSEAYWEEAIYFIHASPVDITTEQIMKLVNYALNAQCVSRVQHSRLRNTVLYGRDGEDNPQQPMDIAAITEAINILSKKVLGAELLTTINNKEEVKWPVH